MLDYSSDAVHAAISAALSRLSDEDVLALRIAVLLNSNPKAISVYSKVSTLFTEEDGTLMEDTMRAAFLAVTRKRLGISS